MLVFILYCILQIVDYYTTWKVLQADGGREANLLMAAMFKRFGVQQTLVIAKTASAGLGAFLFLFGFNIVLTGLAVIYAVAMIGNVRLYLKLQKP